MLMKFFGSPLSVETICNVTHFHFDLLMLMKFIQLTAGCSLTSWITSSWYSFLILPFDVSIELSVCSYRWFLRLTSFDLPALWIQRSLNSEVDASSRENLYVRLSSHCWEHVWIISLTYRTTSSWNQKFKNLVMNIFISISETNYIAPLL